MYARELQKLEFMKRHSYTLNDHDRLTIKELKSLRKNPGQWPYATYGYNRAQRICFIFEANFHLDDSPINRLTELCNYYLSKKDRENYSAVIDEMFKYLDNKVEN